MPDQQPDQQPAPDASPEPEQWLRVAHIVRPHGIRGELIAELLTDFPDRLTTRRTLHLQSPAPGSPPQPAILERARLHSGRLILQLSTAHSMTEAEALRGYHLVIPWHDRAPLDPDSIYLADLIGCQLLDTTSGHPIGTITAVDRESSNLDLLVVTRPAAAHPAEPAAANSGFIEQAPETLIPFVKAYHPVFDPKQRTLHMTIPEGLLDL